MSRIRRTLDDLERAIREAKDAASTAASYADSDGSYARSRALAAEQAARRAAGSLDGLRRLLRDEGIEL